MDDMLFAEEPQSASPHAAEPMLAEPWKLLVVDDEADVHSVTRMALRNFEFLGRPLEILNAYSAREAREILLFTAEPFRSKWKAPAAAAQ